MRACEVSPRLCRSAAQDESDDEDNANKKKPIPSWAQKAALEQAQLRQLHIDPDAIFGVCRKTCNLADVFEGGKKKKCFVERYAVLPRVGCMLRAGYMVYVQEEHR
jgi:hypothetical protein